MAAELKFLLGDNGYLHVQDDAGNCGVFQIDWMMGHRNLTLTLGRHTSDRAPHHGHWVRPCQESARGVDGSTSMCVLDAGHSEPHEPMHEDDRCPWCRQQLPTRED